MTVTVRAFEEEDLSRTAAMWRSSMRSAFPYVPEIQRHTLLDDTEFFRDVMWPRSKVFVATDDLRIVGVLAQAGTFIDHLFIAPDAQRCGVGALLLARAREQSPDHLRLYTFQRNAPARAFYEKHGFLAVRFGVSPAPELEPDVEYHWFAHEQD